MDVNASVLIVWSGAAVEAKASGYNEIEPFHFLCYALKFAEMDTKRLIRENEEELEISQNNLIALLEDHWTIHVPKMSTQLRRALRRNGENPNEEDDQPIHRSKALMEVFNEAFKIAKSEGRSLVDVCDFMPVLLKNQDNWIIGVMKKLGISEKFLDKESATKRSKKFDDVIFPIEGSEYLDADERIRIESDPIVKVVLNYLSQSQIKSRKPCMIIKTGTRYGEDILKDVQKLGHASHSPSIQIESIICNALLEKISFDSGFKDISIIMEIVKINQEFSLFFFDSVHRYLSKPIVGEQFQTLFKQWLLKADGRFIFETTEDQYRSIFEPLHEWKGVFHLIWVHELPCHKEIIL